MVLTEKIAEGKTAEIFLFDDNKIAKVFRNHIPDDFIETELRQSGKVQELGLNVPRVYGEVEMDGKRAILYEKIEGETLLSYLIRHPWKIKFVTKKMVELQNGIHAKSAADLPSFKETLKRRINHVTGLSDEEKVEIINHLNTLSNNERLCHGDFHPDNIMCTSDGYVVIDWTTAVSGCPEADVARTLMILQYADLPVGMPTVIKFLFQRFRKLLYKHYSRSYLELTEIQLEDIKAWELPIMAARLIEGITDEEEGILLSHIRKLIASKE